MSNNAKRDKKTTLKAEWFLPLSAELMEYSHRIGHVGEDPFLQQIEGIYQFAVGCLCCG